MITFRKTILFTITIVAVFMLIKPARAASYSSGRFNQAVTFAGADYINMGNVSDSAKTVSFWVKPNTTTQKFLELNGAAYVEVSGGTVSATGFTSPTIYVDGVAATAIANTNWHHIAVITGTNINANQVNIGKIGTTYFSGLIDSPRIYNRTLSASEIAAQYSLGRNKFDNYSAKIKLAADDSNSYLDESLTNGSDYLLSYWYKMGEDNVNPIMFTVSGAGTIDAEQNLMSTSASGLVGAWNFEEGGSSATTADISGNGNTGTVTNAGGGTNATIAAMWTDGINGKYGRSLEFDGTDDYVDGAGPSFMDGATSGAIEAWIKPNVIGGTAYATVRNVIVGKASLPDNALGFSETENKIRLRLGNVTNLDSITTISEGNWYHITGTWDNPGMKIYINGILDNSNANQVSWYSHVTYGTLIGRIYTGSANGSFTGQIDSVRIYNRALTASEVYDSYRAGMWRKYEVAFEADQTGAHLFKFIQNGATSGNSIVYVDQADLILNKVDKGGMEGTYTDGVAPGWSLQGSGVTPTESANAHTGSKAQQLVISGGSSSPRIQNSSSFWLTSAGWHTFSAWIKSSVTSANAIRLQVADSGSTYTIKDFTAPDTINYNKYSVSFNSSSSASGRWYMTIFNTDGTFLVDDVSLVSLGASTAASVATPSSEANSYATGKWGSTGGDAFRVDGGDRLRYSASGVLPNDAGTISIWWKPMWDYDKFDQNVYILNSESASANLIRVFYDYTNHYYTAQLYNGTNWTTAKTNSAAQTFAEDAWQHIVVSYDNDVGGSAGSVILYINGASSGSAYTGANWTVQTVPDYFYAGSLFGAAANTNQADGWFDDIRIYSGQTSAANINAIYGINPTAPTGATWKRNLITPIIME